VTPHRYIFAGGGTGGHLYPGLAIWREIQALNPHATALFICSSKPLDAEILTREQADFLPIPAKPFAVRPAPLWRFLANWGPSVRASRAAMTSLPPCHDAPAFRGGSVVSPSPTDPSCHGLPAFRSGMPVSPLAVPLPPQTLLSLGGYVSAPAVQAARAERIPITLINLDAVPGKANNWIARHAQTRLTAADSQHVPKDWERLPPIVRREARCTLTQADARRALNLDPNRPTLLITGGSQGAGSLNNFVTTFATQHADLLRKNNWQILHQTGKGEDEKARAVYQAANIQATAVPFLTDMASAWGAATLAIARCGANTVAELWANHVPSILLPYPYHKDEHQKFNAEPLARRGGALIHKDHIDAAKNMQDAGMALQELLESPLDSSANAQSKIEHMRQALQSLGPANGAEQIAKRLTAEGL
jgi:UDP-N-acetylglucosamine--N-acetylmuramyl-(pentapeptide) pyrophosphoryl-undecaprenol N-acetylglucosamine transferase